MRFVCALFVVVGLAGMALAQPPDTVFLEELTWTEVRDALADGTTTVIIPTGGTEQNGPHMVLGKHNFLVKHKAGEVARRLGNALAAPVMAYVPEGDVDPPTGHMRFPGTITTPPEVFERVVEFAARSLRQHGFLDIALLGDSGGNQASQAAVAERLNLEWAATPRAGASPDRLLSGQGDLGSVVTPGWSNRARRRRMSPRSHAGMHDTSSFLFLDPSKLRLDQMDRGTGGTGNGVTGYPGRSTAAYGEQILEMPPAAIARTFSPSS